MKSSDRAAPAAKAAPRSDPYLPPPPRSIALIGLPGSGKTTLGRRLAEVLHLPFYDSDAEVERDAGMTIPAIFDAEGEAGFRARESAVLARLGALPACIIATGGGAVERPENREALRDCLIVYLQRTPEDILYAADLSGRPLLREHTLQELYARRSELYAFWAQVTTDGTDTDAAVRQILSAWREATCVF